MGGGKFRDVTIELGLNEAMSPSSNAAWSDFDRDGDLDLFVGNEMAPCQLFRNDGEDGFTDIAESAGVTNRAAAKGSTWGDFDHDGWPDLYVSNLNAPNRFYRNMVNGRFKDIAAELNMAQPEKSFPTWFWDVNNDGHLDLFVASYNVGLTHVAGDFLGRKYPEDRDRLYLNNGDGQFTESSEAFGLNHVTQPMGCNFGDLDNDGFLDFYLGTGYPDLDLSLIHI